MITCYKEEYDTVEEAYDEAYENGKMLGSIATLSDVFSIIDLRYKFLTKNGKDGPGAKELNKLKAFLDYQRELHG